VSEIESEGHRSWVPLPMDQHPTEITGDLRLRFGPAAGATDEVVELNLAAAQGIVANLRQQAETAADQGTVTCAAWLLVLDPSRFEIRAVAVLRAVAVEPRTSVDDLVRDVVGDDPQHGTPLVEVFETFSGEAVRVRYRPVVEDGGERSVHQVNAVLWDRTDQQVAFLLSCYVDNLVEADDIGDLLDELAAGMRGI
jgi:hypothetical protein